MKTLVLGTGNHILRDDGVGPRVVDETRKRWLGDGADFLTTSQSGMALIDAITGYENLIIIDAIQTGASPGTMYWLTPGDFQTGFNSPACEHNTGIIQLLKLVEELGMETPSQVAILAIEAADVTSFGETMTPEVSNAIPRATNEVVAQLHKMIDCCPAGKIHQRYPNLTRVNENNKQGDQYVENQ